MSYTIQVAGHKDGLGAEEAEEFELAIAERARAFVAELEGVTSAEFAGQTVNVLPLMPEQAEQAEEPAQ